MRAVLVVTLLVLLLFVHAKAQEPEYEWDDAKRADAKAVADALASADRAWSFLLAPDSPYAERRAVAREIGRLLKWSDLQRIQTAREEAQRELQRRGKPLDWPVTFKARSEMPAPWQIERAMDDAYGSVFRHGDANAFFAFARALPCGSAEEAAFYKRVTTDLAKERREMMPVEIIGAWRNLMLRNDGNVSRDLGPFLHSWTLRFDDETMWRYAHVVLIDRAETGDIYTSSFYLNELRERINSVPGQTRPGKVPYTAALLMSRRALSDESRSGYERVMTVISAGRVLGTYTPPEGLSPTVDEDQPALLRHFAEWFAKNEEPLAANAAKETEALAKARAELAAITQCRAAH